MPNFPPFASIEEDEIIEERHIAEWPEWSAKLISPGCKIQTMHWHDGTITTRMLCPQRSVLAAVIEGPQAQM